MASGESHLYPPDDRLLDTLQRLLALEAVGLQTAMQQAAQQVAEVLDADKADVFLHEPAGDMLVAVGTSDTPMGRRQAELGLDRLAVADGGGTVRVFRTGRSYLTEHLDRDGDELEGVVEGLGVRSTIGVPLEVAGECRGVLMVSSATPEFYSERDLRFSEAVARWVGLVGYRAAYVEQLAARAAEESLRLAAEELVGLLTPRQREIARLIAAGLSNAEIAQQLVLTRGTVANHVEHILKRLGFRSRTQVAVWAAERGLMSPDDNSEDGPG